MKRFLLILSLAIAFPASAPADDKAPDQAADAAAEEAHLHQVNYPVVTELSSPEYKKKFERIVCGGRSIKSAACKKKYEDTFIAKLQETYPLAQAKSFKVWCKANPMDCGDWDKIEDQYRDSNVGMNTVARTEREERDARAESAHKRRLLNILTNHRTGTACTKTVDGNTVRTECD